MHKSNQTGGLIYTRATRQEGRYTQGQPDRRADIHKSNQTGGPTDTSATRQELAQRTVAHLEMGTCAKDSVGRTQFELPREGALRSQKRDVPRM